MPFSIAKTDLKEKPNIQSHYAKRIQQEYNFCMQTILQTLYSSVLD